MDRGHVYLIGGGEIARQETQVIDTSIKSLAELGSTFLFLPTAAGDAEGYIRTIEHEFGDTFKVLALTKALGREHAIAALEQARIIYLGGGKTQLLLELVAEWDLLPALRASWERGAHIAGMSAGAQALAAWYVHEENGGMDLREGWGLVPLSVLVHATEDSDHRAQELWSSHPGAHQFDLVAIPEAAAWVIRDGTAHSIGSHEVHLVTRLTNT